MYNRSMKNEMIELIDAYGNKKKFVVLLVFKWYKTNKYYIVYTDEKRDINDVYDIYASTFNPKDLSELESIKNDFEWDEINKRLESMGMKNESRIC